VDDINNRTETQSCFIEELGQISASGGNYTTIRMERWHYYIDRAKLMLIQGWYNKDELIEIVDKCNRADADIEAGLSPPDDCPKHFTLVCRPLDLVRLARDILNLYKGYENIL
jgi:hypothetical protein